MKSKSAAKLAEDLEKKKLQLKEDQGQRLPSFAAPSLAQQQQEKSGATGLLTVEEFKKKRQQMQLESQMKKEKEQRVAKQQNKRKALKNKARLSFMEEEEDNDEAGEKKRTKIGKDPTVDTGFLPDKERDEKEKQLRKELAEAWEREQELVKQETFVVTYSYWDGKGHRRAQRVIKGSTIGEFLSLVKQSIEDIANVSTQNLLFIKEDMIIPHHFTFYELITTKAKAKNGGPLFNFDVYDDVRLLHDATKEKDESHAAKVCERRWYDQNRHIFPASRWTVFEG